MIFFLYLCPVLNRKSQVVAHPGFLIIDLINALARTKPKTRGRVT